MFATITKITDKETKNFEHWHILVVIGDKEVYHDSVNSKKRAMELLSQFLINSME